jgi:phosphatidylglycerol:prolipoprotein diacylglycerol transferase
MRPLLVATLSRWLGPFAALVVPTYAVMLAIGSLLGAAWAIAAARARGFRRTDAIEVLAVAYVTGLLGGVAVPGVQALASWLGGGPLRPPTGMAAYGGLVGGSLGAIVALRRRKLDAWAFLDTTCPALGLGYFCARIGCLLAGCDYGRPLDASWAVRFPPTSPAARDQVALGWIRPGAWSLPVHPTQIYMALVGLALFYGVQRLDLRVPGRRFGLMVVAYAVARAAIETLRGDASRGHVGPLSTSQAIALATVLAVAPLLLWPPSPAASLGAQSG